jgi:hypothetical protein
MLRVYNSRGRAMHTKQHHSPNGRAFFFFFFFFAPNFRERGSEKFPQTHGSYII